MANRSLNDDFNLSNENIANPFSVSYPSQTPVFNSLKPQVLERPSYNDDPVPKKTSSISPQSLKDFIAKKRDIFLVEYGLSVKRDDLFCLENSALGREVELVQAERLLEEDATNFDEFLRDTNLITQRTISASENYFEERMEKSHYCQKLKTEIILHKTEISRNDELLAMVQNYELFLKCLISSDRKSKTNSHLADSNSDLDRQFSPLSVLCKQTCDSIVSPLNLLDILTALEENNLSLILNSQEVEEALEDLIHSSKLNKDKLSNHVNSLNTQIYLLQSNIFDVQSHAKDLEIKAKMFSYGEFKEEDQDYLQNIDKTVQKVYIHCIGHNEANIGTLQMLSSIENRVEELFDTLEGLSSEKVKNAELARGKERRILLREKKIEEEKFHQDDRMKRSLARANANPRIINGRKLLFRSNPPKGKQLKALCGQRKDRDEEDHLYYFS